MPKVLNKETQIANNIGELGGKAAKFYEEAQKEKEELKGLAETDEKKYLQTNLNFFRNYVWAIEHGHITALREFIEYLKEGKFNDLFGEPDKHVKPLGERLQTLLETIEIQGDIEKRGDIELVKGEKLVSYMTDIANIYWQSKESFLQECAFYISDIAANLGDSKAMDLLGNIYLARKQLYEALGNIYLARKQPYEAAKWLKKSADEGYALGAYDYALLLDEEGVNGDSKDILKYYIIAADAGIPGAQLNLANTLRDELKSGNFGILIGNLCRIHRERKAGGNADSFLTSFHKFFYTGKKRRNIDEKVNFIHEKITDLYRKSCEKDVLSMIYYARCLEKGEGTKKNLLEAERLYKKVLESDPNNEEANYYYACFLMDEPGAAEKTEALERFKKMAEGGHVKSMIKYVYFCENDKDAELWYGKAIDEAEKKGLKDELAEAKIYLARRYEKKYPAAKEKEIYQLYREVADSGNLWGRFYLALCIEKGTGVKIDLRHAIVAYEDLLEQVEGGGNLKIAKLCEEHIKSCEESLRLPEPRKATTGTLQEKKSSVKRPRPVSVLDLDGGLYEAALKERDPAKISFYADFLVTVRSKPIEAIILCKEVLEKTNDRDFAIKIGKILCDHWNIQEQDLDGGLYEAALKERDPAKISFYADFLVTVRSKPIEAIILYKKVLDKTSNPDFAIKIEEILRDHWDTVLELLTKQQEKADSERSSKRSRPDDESTKQYEGSDTESESDMEDFRPAQPPELPTTSNTSELPAGKKPDEGRHTRFTSELPAGKKPDEGRHTGFSAKTKEDDSDVHGVWR